MFDVKNGPAIYLLEQQKLNKEEAQARFDRAATLVFSTIGVVMGAVSIVLSIHVLLG
tara:strand:- start:250 stop:420 length:171 start_codon:yes stop_codon:yes gene_type:complete